MTQTEALKLALEALESVDWYINQLEMLVYSADDTGTHEERAKVQATIAAIKEALVNVPASDTSQEPVDETAKQRHITQGEAHEP